MPVPATPTTQPAPRFTAIAGEVLEMVGNRLIVRDLDEVAAQVVEWTQLALREKHLRKRPAFALIYERDTRELAAAVDAAMSWRRCGQGLSPVEQVRRMLAGSLPSLNPEPPPAAA